MGEIGNPTPTPWRVTNKEGGQRNGHYGYAVEIIAFAESVICRLPGLHAATNAAFIVEAVNSHASLHSRITELEANERAYEDIIGKKTYREVADEISKLRKALENIATSSEKRGNSDVHWSRWKDFALELIEIARAALSKGGAK